MRNRITAAIVITVMSMAFLPQLASGYQLGSRWSSTATSGSGLGQGDATTITWSIIPDGTWISGGGGSDLIANLDSWVPGGSGSDLTARPWFSIFDNSFGRMAQVSGLTAVYEANDDGQSLDGFAPPYGQTGVRGDVRVGGHYIDGQSGQNALAYNYYPNDGDMVIDTSNSDFYSNSANSYRAMRNVLMHEHGHGLGLAHVESNNASFLMEPYSNTSFDGPQFDDILALHRHYGDANEKANNEAGNDTTANATSLGTVAVGQTVGIGKDATDAVVASTDTDFVSIDDNSDVDFFSFTVSEGVLVDLLLAPMGPTYMEGPQYGTQSSFAASSQSDLALELFDTNGTTSLGLSDNIGTGWSEGLTEIALDAGTYFIKITGDHNAAQMYGLDLSVAIKPEIIGDANRDGIVDAADFSILSANWMGTGKVWDDGDFNSDGVVNASDFSLLSAYWQTGAAPLMEFQTSLSQAPEPATMSLLGLGSLALLRRRRRA